MCDLETWSCQFWFWLAATLSVGPVTLTTVACAEPKLTFAPDSKFVPVRVTVWPPLVEPVAGRTAEITGGAAAFTVSVPLVNVTE